MTMVLPQLRNVGKGRPIQSLSLGKAGRRRILKQKGIASRGEKIHTPPGPTPNPPPTIKNILPKVPSGKYDSADGMPEKSSLPFAPEREVGVTVSFADHRGRDGSKLKKSYEAGGGRRNLPGLWDHSRSEEVGKRPREVIRTCTTLDAGERVSRDLGAGTVRPRRREAHPNSYSCQPQALCLDRTQPGRAELENDPYHTAAVDKGLDAKGMQTFPLRE